MIHSDLLAAHALRSLGIHCRLVAYHGTPRCWLVRLPNGEERRVSGWVLGVMFEKRGS